MGTYVNSHLDPGESVVCEAQLHWIVYFTPVIILGLGIGVAADGFLAGGLSLLVMGIFALLGAWVRQISSEFVVTNQRLVFKVGFLSRRTIELNMAKVESVQVDQSIFGRMLNYGSITVSGTGGTKEPFTMISDPIAFRQAVRLERGD